MAYDKRMIQRLISRPEMMGLDEMDKSGEALAPDESQDTSIIDDMGESELPVDDMIETVDEEQDPELLAEAPLESETPEIDSELTAMLKKLKSGQPLEDDSGDQANQETAGDPNASVEMRKAAIKKIKEKYLGQ